MVKIESNSQKVEKPKIDSNCDHLNKKVDQIIYES